MGNTETAEDINIFFPNDTGFIFMCMLPQSLVEFKEKPPDLSVVFKKEENSKEKKRQK